MNGPIFTLRVEDAAVSRRNRLAYLLPPAVFLLGLIGLVAGLDLHADELATMSGIGVAVALFAFLLVLATDPFRLREHGQLDVFEDHLTIGRHRVERARIKTGYVQPFFGGKRPVVRLLDRFGSLKLTVEVPAIDAGRALLSALELDAANAPAHFRVGSRWSYGTHAGRAFGLVALVGGMLTVAASFAQPLLGTGVFCVGILALVVMSARRAKLTVGADGLALRWFGTRFVPFARLRRAQACADGVAIDLDSERLVLATRTNASAGHDLLAASIIERIDQAMEMQRAGDVDVSVVSISNVRGAERVRALRALTHVDTSYRRIAVRPERLLRIVEDVGVEESARASAAVALAPTLDAGGRAKLLRIAEACASPDVRAVIELAAQDEAEALLAAALDACVDDRARVA